MNRITLGVIAAAATCALAAAGCSTTVSKAESKAKAEAVKHGVEVIDATVAGAAAANQLNSGGPNVPFKFPDGAFFEGPVQTEIKPFSLGGPPTGTSTFVTPVGNLVVVHTAAAGYGPNSAPHFKWDHRDGACYYIATFTRGTFTWDGSKSTGKFAGVSSDGVPGVFSLIATGHAPLKSGQTTCSMTSTGATVSDGAGLTFDAAGKMKVKS